MTAPPQLAPIPAGFRITLDPKVKRLDDSTLFGGAPARVLRLSVKGQVALREIEDGPVYSPSARALARRLTDGGLAHPHPPVLEGAPALTVSVVVPVYERADDLDRCLQALGRDYPVIVVDDASPDSAPIAAVVARHGARLIRRDRNGGPAAARNDGLALIDTALVAFIDSDCIPTPGSIAALAGHLRDPLVVAAAPRVTPIVADTFVGRYTRVRSSLDLGPAEGRVLPMTAVSYVPTAALVVRTSALRAVSGPAGVFDPALRYGEDVDLVWRLHDAGGRIRYDPSVVVAHREPDRWAALLARRFHYGTSAAPLADRHPGQLTPLVIVPAPALAAVLLAGRRPVLAGGCFAVAALSLRRSVIAAKLPPQQIASTTARMTGQMWLGIGRYLGQFGGPAVIAAILLRRRVRRLVLPGLIALAVTPGAVTWATQRPALDPLRTILAQLADDAAYGAGVWVGCLRRRTFSPLQPRRWRSLAGVRFPRDERPDQ